MNSPCLLNDRTQHARRQPIPDQAIGIGLRAPHHQRICDQNPDIDWLELHSENFFTAGTPQRHQLDKIANHYPLSFHGIGLSLGSVDPLNAQHLARLNELINEYHPALVSEHLSWSSFNGRYFNDLLPMPYTQESLQHFSDRVSQLQDYLGRQVLIENPTAYLSVAGNQFSEAEFLGELHQRTQCGLLLDLNNIYVNSINHHFDPYHYLAEIPVTAVEELHLAGFTRKPLDNGEMLIDTHASAVAEPVWQLFRHYRHQCNAPALIERDANIPPLHELLAEASIAKQIQSDLEQNTRGQQQWRCG